MWSKMKNQIEMTIKKDTQKKNKWKNDNAMWTIALLQYTFTAINAMSARVRVYKLNVTAFCFRFNLNATKEIFADALNYLVDG